VRYQIIDLDIHEISFVDKPANRKKYIFIKNRGGENKMDPMKLEALSYDDRIKLEAEVKAKILPDLQKTMEATFKADFEKTFTAEKIEALKAELRPDIEIELREEYEKQDKGVSKDAAMQITTVLKDVIKSAAALSKLVGFSYKASNVNDEAERLELEKSINELKENMFTKEDFEKMLEIK